MPNLDVRGLKYSPGVLRMMAVVDGEMRLQKNRPNETDRRPGRWITGARTRTSGNCSFSQTTTDEEVWPLHGGTSTAYRWRD